MKCGVLIFAHNSKDVDYALMAIVAGKLAGNALKVPVSLVTDDSTVSWLKESGSYSIAESIFEHIILIDRPQSVNKRRLADGRDFKMVSFINDTRPLAWDITPYDRTLLIDSDYLIFSDRLNEFWNVEKSVLISTAMNDIRGDRARYLDKNVSETGVHLYWATTVMFTKNAESKVFFDTVKLVQRNYSQYADVYRFNPMQYRNDIAFSIAKHILDGFITDTSQMLPPVLTAIDSDILLDVIGKKLLFLITTPENSEAFLAHSISNTDIHIMNKQSIIRNADKLMGIE